MLTAKEMIYQYYWHNCSTALKNAFSTLALYEIIDPIEYDTFSEETQYWYCSRNNEICDYNEGCYIRHKETNEGITLIMVHYDRD